MIQVKVCPLSPSGDPGADETTACMHRMMPRCLLLALVGMRHCMALFHDVPSPTCCYLFSPKYAKRGVRVNPEAIETSNQTSQ